MRFMNLLTEKADEAGPDEVEESGKGIMSMIGEETSGYAINLH